MNKIRSKYFIKVIGEITEYYKKLIFKTKHNQSIGSINEWVIDNYYIISEQEKSVRDEFRGREIKYINKKRKKQIYTLIYNTLKANDFQIDMETLFKRLNNYQLEKNDYFSYYEIIFINLCIRMSLINELNILCKKLDNRLMEKDQVDKTFDLICKNINNNMPLELSHFININDDKIKNAYYIEQLNYKLKELGQLSESAFITLNELLLKNELSLRELIEQSHKEMASDNLLIINIFESFKKVSKYKIENFYKKMSFTEKVLINEKADVYAHIYDNNKNEYRESIIRNARKAGINEYVYATEIVSLANKEGKHVGWYLFDNKNYMRRARLYILSITILTIFISFLIAKNAGFWFFFIILIPISGLIIDIVCHILMKYDDVNSLFKLKFEEGLPSELSTMVVIPTIVNSKKKVIDMFETLENYYLSNKTDNIYFTLLGDCTNENVKSVLIDNEVVEAGLNKISELNEKYGKNIFYFVYRNRFYSESEESYIGFERKRGALIHFNKLLLNKFTEEEKTKYFNCHTFNNFKTPIKYVITLDTDTKLVLNTALKLVGAMAHPMNRPVLSEDKRRVISGYGIMQPRINIDVEVTSKSQYSQLFAGLGGLDVYTTASFDLYQDIFNEGSFVGKGIYDLEVFDQVLGEAFPNNLILSHDLLEGNYLRCGFINDVELFDDYPSSYLTDAKRHHRWNRGDWQIIGWLKRKVKNTKGEIVSNPITVLSKWKIFDNLRRSLTSLFLLLIFFYGFTIGAGSVTNYLILIGIIVTTPILFYLISKVLYRNKYDRFLKYYLNLIKGVLAVVNKSFIAIVVLPYEAYLFTDSMIKALYRMFISKKRLLNWITAEEVERTLKNDLQTYIRNFKVNYIVSILLIICAIVFKPEDLTTALIIAFIWFSAPFLMCSISESKVDDVKSLDQDEMAEIKDIAFRTWKYFNDFLREECNYLIPDNYQQNREIRLDHKTSPTNIGLSLISVISAFELGFINNGRTIMLLTNIIKSIERLEKWNGHLFNWYNINTLEKMQPYFISSIDNGNLMASLFVVKSFLEKRDNRDLLYRVKNLISDMDFKKLYNDNLDVFSIGYNLSEQSLFPYHYNNFASEARITSFVSIAKGDVPYKHWFCLDKTLTKHNNYKGVASWSGTAFEYFMPLIFMKTYKHTLLDETYYYAYYAQREFMREIDPDLPWGISESAYNELDDAENYKYKPFGIPYLKLQESASYRIVLSPYSSLMAISIDDREVYDNINKFKKLNMYDEYGFYEAYDGDDNAIVKSYYAHHQGMILSSLANYLKDNIIQEYFHNDKNIESIEILLKEKVQIKTYIDLKIAKYKKYQYSKERQENDVRECNALNSIPEMGVLSNGGYSVLINDRGVGLSKYKNLQINRHRNITNEHYGMFLYIKNTSNNKIWSNTYAPLNIKPDNYKVVFASDRIKYIREDDGIVTTTEMAVVKDHNAEIRKVSFKNNTDKDVLLEVTSYGEVILCRNEEDVAHRTFNSLSIFSELDVETSSLIFSRKSRSKENTRYYMANRMFLDNDEYKNIEFETSRHNFIGRNRSTANPEVIEKSKDLSNTVGASLDPIMSIRKQIKVEAKETAKLYMLVAFGKSREQVMEIVNTYKDSFSINKAFDMTTLFNNIRTSYGKLNGSQMRLYNMMLKYIFAPLPITSERKEKLQLNNHGQPTLWKYGISGDLPIILVDINKIEDIGFIKEVLELYEFYKVRAIYVDIVIINNECKTKQELVLNYINNVLYNINNINYFDKTPGEVYVIESSNINEEDKALLEIVSRISLKASCKKSLGEQLNNLINVTEPLPNESICKTDYLDVELPKDIELYNGFGGFVNQGREYLIDKDNTPTPWVNVIANEKIGTIISNNASSFTFAYNSREFKLTSWSNDWVSDPSSEEIVINNHKFKPTFVKHGFGYTILYSSTKEYDVFMKVFVSKEDTVKFYELKITNKTGITQTIKVDFLAKIVVGITEELTNRYVYTNFDKERNLLSFKNTYNNHFKNSHVFLSSTEPIVSYNDKKIETKSITINVNLDAGEEKSFSFMLGCEDENNILDKYEDMTSIKEEFTEVIKYWDDLLSTITVNTPDKSFNYALNGWLLYQTYASRLFAKAGFYQVGGAFGFRDQLQDVMAILYSDPKRAREQILRHAKHQFQEGDVLHWWHEELNVGSRTKFTDDYLWLVYVTSEYINITGDYSILDEKACFVGGEALKEQESEKGITFYYTEEQESLYNHLKLCITRSLSRFGHHGLPLMGSGDWNDGMNKVGHKGRGESVFVGFFLYDILLRMSEISKKYNDCSFAEECLDNRDNLRSALDKNAWDGAWYLRAYFDNGDSLGSRNNYECKIDLLCQAWSIISNLAPEGRRKTMFNAVEQKLVDKENGIIKLLTPAFKDSSNNPGYIKDYLPGTRENGGQYTHAALWYILALLKDNQIDRAYEHYQMINPMNRTSSKEGVLKYKVEPYVIAADIYSNKDHLGRGGWTWYTGSSGWSYKIAIEEILGFKKTGNTLTINPKINKEWDGFEITYKYLNTRYLITVINSKHLNSGKIEIMLDNRILTDNIIKLIDDGREHIVIVNMKEDL